MTANNDETRAPAARGSGVERPITMSTYGPLAECEAERARRTAGASQASTAGAAKVITNVDTPELRAILDVIAAHGDIRSHDIKRLNDYYLAHVARQESATAYAHAVEQADGHVSLLMGAASEAARRFWAGSGAAIRNLYDHPAAPSESAADTGAVDAAGVDTAELLALVKECHAGYQYGPSDRFKAARAALVAHIATLCAQQREAGRLEIAGLKWELESAEQAVKYWKTKAALARQPVSEGPAEVTDAMVEAAEKAQLRHTIEDRRRGGHDPELGYKAIYRVMRTAAPPTTRSVPMILHCPACGLQHIDAPDERTEGWDNPPHKSHLCHGCGHIWRPADVPTEGVAAIQTRGSNDSAAPPAKELTPEQIDAAWVKVNGGRGLVPRDLIRRFVRELQIAPPAKVEGLTKPSALDDLIDNLPE